MNESAAKVAGLYKGLSYNDQYGGSVVIVVILIIILFLVYSYFKTSINAQPIRDNWPKYRCRPDVIPFAGMINKPDGETTIGYTQKNFNYCLNEMVKPITKKAVNPIDYLMSGLMKVFSIISHAIKHIRNMIANMRSRLAKIVRNIFQRILAMLIPIQEMMIRTKDLFGKSIAILKVGLETAVGSYVTLKSSMGVMVTAGAWSLIIGAGILVGLFALFIAAVLFFPWTLGYVLFLIASFTAAYIVIMVLVLIIITFMESVMEVRPNLQVAPPPKRPPPPATCFDQNTIITLVNGTQKRIKDVVVGDTLHDEGRVTAIFMLNSFTQPMYKLSNVIVSGSHKVKVGNDWICVKEHPDAIELEDEYNEPYVYNLNTTTKEIVINGQTFCDWDEISDDICLKLITALSHNLSDDSQKNILRRKDKSFIHKYFDGGFEETANVNMINGTTQKIKDIKISDMLSTGGTVYGTVKIQKPGIYTSEYLDNPNTTELYHLLVHGNTNKFVVNNYNVFDYNYYIESVI